MIYWPVRGWSERQRYERVAARREKKVQGGLRKKRRGREEGRESDEVMRKVKVRTMQPRVDTAFAKAFSLDDE